MFWIHKLNLSLPMILNWEELLIPSRAERPFREIWIGKTAG